MPATFFAKPISKTANFRRNTASRSSTTATYYEFKKYSRDGAPSASEMVICRNEEDHATTIITPRLLFRSLNQIEKDELIEGLREILMDPVNVQKYWDGLPWSEERLNSYIEQYSADWEQGKKFSVYAIYDVLDPDKIIGALDLCEYSSFAGYENAVALGYILLLSTHGQKIGREIGEVGWQAFMHEVEKAINAGQIPHTGLVATAHPDNLASLSILNHVLGDAVPGVKSDYGPDQPRNVFFRSPEPINSETQSNKCEFSP